MEEESIKLEMRSVTKFKQGGIVIELMTQEAATFICNNLDIKNTLACDPNLEATFKERTYPLIVPFILVNYNPNNNDSIKQLEKENR